jgi:uncharacterized LabA/DUF88 family protein
MTEYSEDGSVDPSTVKPQRVGVYIDGFNLYHGMMGKRWGHFRWLDLRQLVEGFMRPPERLDQVRYFTALVSHDRPAAARQRVFLDALAARGGLSIHLGAFEQRQVKCHECGKWYKRHQEKRTDVNIATCLVADAHDRLFDSVYLMSADADLIPAIEYVRTRFSIHVTLLDPPHRHSDDLKAICDRNLHIKRGLMRDCQLPNPVERLTPRGRIKRYYRPEEWER